ncbi:MAG: SpoIID/LytB domain-containing protein, partial [Actinobacteria bacterium]|nr:SpoIID/LytB domain-containing protein [Actinomycetota bacterium]
IPSVTGVNGEVEALPSGKAWTVRWTGTRYLSGANSIVTFKKTGTITKYRYGQIQIKLVKVPVLGYRIEVTNTVRLHDEYLWGLGEMPSSWPFASLQAQVIASRTYALNKAGKIRSACDCNLYNASQDQSFIGYAKEAEPRYGKIWKSAVTSTSVESNTGLAVLYNSKPIGTYFFSSSAGQTETSKNVWGTDLPYIASMPDPWSLNPAINPKYFEWVRTVSQSVLATAFELPDVVFIQETGLHDNATQLKISGTSSDGRVVTITGEQFRSRTRLPSAWFGVVGPTIIAASPSPTPTQLPSQSPTPTQLPSPTPTSVGMQD